MVSITCDVCLHCLPFRWKIWILWLLVFTKKSSKTFNFQEPYVWSWIVKCRVSKCHNRKIFRILRKILRIVRQTKKSCILTYFFLHDSHILCDFRCDFCTFSCAKSTFRMSGKTYSKKVYVWHKIICYWTWFVLCFI